MWCDDEALYSQVKGIHICINVWLVVEGLRNAGVPIGKNNTVGLERFNKVQFFKSCLRNPHNESKSYSVGGLAVTPCILTFIVIWLLTPRLFNYIARILPRLLSP